jgi:hypothetical protein
MQHAMNDRFSSIVRAALVSGALAACGGQQPEAETPSPSEEKHHCAGKEGCGPPPGETKHHCKGHAEHADDAGVHPHAPE